MSAERSSLLTTLAVRDPRGANYACTTRDLSLLVLSICKQIRCSFLVPRSSFLVSRFSFLASRSSLNVNRCSFLVIDNTRRSRPTRCKLACTARDLSLLVLSICKQIRSSFLGGPTPPLRFAPRSSLNVVRAVDLQANSLNVPR